MTLAKLNWMLEMRKRKVNYRQVTTAIQLIESLERRPKVNKAYRALTLTNAKQALQIVAESLLVSDVMLAEYERMVSNYEARCHSHTKLST